MSFKNEEVQNSGDEPVETSRSWLICVACMVINAILFGQQRLAGLLLVASVETYHISRKTASVPFTQITSTRNLIGPVIGFLGQKFGVRVISAIGAVVSAVSIGLCYIAKDINEISVFYGLGFGIGLSMGNILLPVCINKHFSQHRASANGLAFSGGCIGSFVLPLLFEVLMDNYGLNGTFLILSGLVLNCLPLALVLHDSNVDSRKKQAKCVQQNQPKLNAVCDEKSVSTHVENGDEESQETIPRTSQGDGPNAIIKDSIVQSSAQVHIKHIGKPIAETPSKKKRGALMQTLSLFINPMFLVLAVVNAVMSISFLAFLTTLIDFSKDLGLQDTDAKYIMIAFSIGDFIGRLGLGVVPDRGWMTVFGFGGTCLLLQGLAVMCITWASNFWSLIVITVTYSIFEGGYFTIFAILFSEGVGKDLQTIAIPSSAVLIGLLFEAMPSLIGYFRESLGSYNGLYYLLGVSSLVCSIVTYLFPRLKRRLENKVT